VSLEDDAFVDRGDKVVLGKEVHCVIQTRVAQTRPVLETLKWAGYGAVGGALISLTGPALLPAAATGSLIGVGYRVLGNSVAPAWVLGVVAGLLGGEAGGVAGARVGHVLVDLPLEAIARCFSKDSKQTTRDRHRHRSPVSDQARGVLVIDAKSLLTRTMRRMLPSLTSERDATA
jgi:hypothetical protein